MPELAAPDRPRRAPRVTACAMGPHTCIAMHLARREFRIVLVEAFLARFRNMRIAGDETDRFHSGVAVIGIDCLPIRWERA